MGCEVAWFCPLCDEDHEFLGVADQGLMSSWVLLAVRMGEMWPPQLARQLATIDEMLGGRLTINIISSDLPGEKLASAPRYQRTLEIMRACPSWSTRPCFPVGNRRSASGRAQ